MVRRATVACAQGGWVVDAADLLLVKPIDAVAGYVPNGDAARFGSSHACSGSRPCPEVMFCIAVSRVRADDPRLEAMSYSARSPLSTGHRWPEPTLLPSDGHGAPSTVQLVGSGVQQSP